MSDYGTPTISGGREPPIEVSVTLNDLLYRGKAWYRDGVLMGWNGPSRTATLDDLIQVLEGMGAKVEEARQTATYAHRSVWSVDVAHRLHHEGAPGSYLVLPLKGEQ